MLVLASACKKISAELPPLAHHLLPLTGDQQPVEERAVGERVGRMALNQYCHVLEQWLRCRKEQLICEHKNETRSMNDKLGNIFICLSANNTTLLTPCTPLKFSLSRLLHALLQTLCGQWHVLFKLVALKFSMRLNNRTFKIGTLRRRRRQRSRQELCRISNFKWLEEP